MKVAQIKETLRGDRVRRSGDIVDIIATTLHGWLRHHHINDNGADRDEIARCIIAAVLQELEKDGPPVSVVNFVTLDRAITDAEGSKGLCPSEHRLLVTLLIAKADGWRLAEDAAQEMERLLQKFCTIGEAS